MVKLPPSSRLPQTSDNKRPSKSDSDLTQPSDVPLHSRSAHDISSDPKGNAPSNVRKTAPVTSPDAKAGTSNKNQPPNTKKIDKKDTKNAEKEQKKQEKKNIAEQKKRDKVAAQERAKEEKIRMQREKAAQKQAKEARKKDKTKTAVPGPRTNPLAQGVSQYPTNPQTDRQFTRNPQTDAQYSSNTLESSISKASGPPPYAEATKGQVVENESDNIGNTSFGKPVDSGSTWDMISQHRQQISRPVVAKTQKETIDATGRKSIYV